MYLFISTTAKHALEYAFSFGGGHSLRQGQGWLLEEKAGTTPNHILVAVTSTCLAWLSRNMATDLRFFLGIVDVILVWITVGRSG